MLLENATGVGEMPTATAVSKRLTMLLRTKVGVDCGTTEQKAGDVLDPAAAAAADVAHAAAATTTRAMHISPPLLTPPQPPIINRAAELEPEPDVR